MAIAGLVGTVGRWSYFVCSFFIVIGAFIQLNIYFENSSCETQYGAVPDINCVGRSLAWVTDSSIVFDADYNFATWRQVFSFSPDIFFTIWTPFFMGFCSFFQHFKGGKWDFISGSYLRVLVWLIFWALWGVFGFASNWGVFWGFILMFLVCVLYLLLIFIGSPDEEPVLQIDVGVLLGRYFPGLADKIQNNNNNNNNNNNDNNNSAYGNGNSNPNGTYESNYVAPHNGSYGGNNPPPFDNNSPPQFNDPNENNTPQAI